MQTPSICEYILYVVQLKKMIPIHVYLKPLVLGQEIQDSSFKSVFDRRGYILNLCCRNFTMLLLKIVHELNT